MALSLMTVAFAKDASDYADYGKVTHDEAADIMTSAGIFDDMGNNNFQPTGTLTCEQACIMAFNTIQAPMVGYTSKGTAIEVSGATVTFGARKASYVTTTRANEQTISSETLSNSGQFTIEFAEYYCRDLRLTKSVKATEQYVDGKAAEAFVTMRCTMDLSLWYRSALLLKTEKGCKHHLPA